MRRSHAKRLAMRDRRSYEVVVGSGHAAVDHVRNRYGVSEDVSGRELSAYAAAQVKEYGGDHYPDSIGGVHRRGNGDGGLVHRRDRRERERPASSPGLLARFQSFGSRLNHVRSVVPRWNHEPYRAFDARRARRRSSQGTRRVTHPSVTRRLRANGHAFHLTRTTMSETTRTDDDRVERDDYDTNPDESGKWISALIALLGLWMMLEAFLFDIILTQFWNDVLVGALLLAVGGYNYYRRADQEVGSMAAAGIAALLGLWLIAAPFVLGTGGEAAAVETANDLAFWNDVVAGLIALGLGAYSAYEVRKDRRDIRRATGVDS